MQLSDLADHHRFTSRSHSTSPLQPELLAAAGLAGATLERALALGHRQLSWRLFDFRLVLGFVALLHSLGDRRLEREADSLGLGIDREHFALDLFPFLHDVLDPIDLVVRQL